MKFLMIDKFLNGFEKLGSVSHYDLFGKRDFKYDFLNERSINSIKWNQCIDNSFNCRIYSYDWHLDRTAIEWDALIYGNYKFIMPLPYRKKWGIKYLFQPLSVNHPLD